jgi:hypothetical protein
MNKKILFLFSTVIIVFSACTEKINLNLDKTYTRLVVDGYIRNDKQAYKINLTKTSDYFANVPSPRVVNAVVTLSDGSTVDTLTETDPGISGVYTTKNDFAGIIGHDYKLNIHLADAIAGKTEYSASCKLLQVTTLDSVKTVFKPDLGKKGFWEVKLYAQDPPGHKNYYLLNLYKNGKLWSDTITKVTVSDNQFFEGNYIPGIEVFFIDNSREYETLKEGDTIILELSAITKEYFDFINQVQQSGFNIPFFSGPPANVVGNIDNGGVGFFAAYSSSSAETIVRK